MEIEDSVLKQYLKNVYFLAGMPCGGKTTISRELGRRHSLPVYDVDERFPIHQQMSSPAFQPAMNQVFANADAFFGRSVEEYAGWLLHNTREQYERIRKSAYFWLERDERSTVEEFVRKVEAHFQWQS